MAGRLALIVSPLRTALLVALAISAAAAIFLYHPAPSLAAAVIICAGIAWILFRYWPLALLTAIAPLPGLLWFPHAVTSYPLSFAFCLLMADAFSDRILRGETKQEAFAGQFEGVVAIAGALLAACLWSPWGARDFLATFASSLAAVILLPSATQALAFGEGFFSAANRAREARAGAAAAMARIAERRWVLSLCGMLAVFCLLGLAAGPQQTGPSDIVGLCFIALAVLVMTGDGRAACAALISGGVLLTLVQAATLSLLVFSVLAIFLARATRAAIQRNHPTTAWSRTLENRCWSIFFSGLGAASAAASISGLFAGWDVLLALIDVLFFFPAVTLLLHGAVPKRQTVETLYRA